MKFFFNFYANFKKKNKKIHVLPLNLQRYSCESHLWTDLTKLDRCRPMGFPKAIVYEGLDSILIGLG